jgi:hypothetical protein
MTVSYPEIILPVVLGNAALHTIAEVAAVVCLVALLLVREMVRRRQGPGSHAVVPSLTALAVPLAVAWAFIVVERFLELVGG